MGGWGRMLDLDLMPVSRLGKSAPTSICCGILIPVTGSNRPLQRVRQVDRATVSPAGEKCRPNDGQAASDKVYTHEADEVIDYSSPRPSQN